MKFEFLPVECDFSTNNLGLDIACGECNIPSRLRRLHAGDVLEIAQVVHHVIKLFLEVVRQQFSVYPGLLGVVCAKIFATGVE